MKRRMTLLLFLLFSGCTQVNSTHKFEKLRPIVKHSKVSVNLPEERGKSKMVYPFMVQRAPEKYRGRRVTWKGMILSLSEMKHTTLLKAVSCPNDRCITGKYGTEFFIEVPGYLDSMTYVAGSRIVATGLVADVIIRGEGASRQIYPGIKPLKLDIFKIP